MSTPQWVPINMKWRIPTYSAEFVALNDKFNEATAACLARWKQERPNEAVGYIDRGTYNDDADAKINHSDRRSARKAAEQATEAPGKDHIEQLRQQAVYLDNMDTPASRAEAALTRHWISGHFFGLYQADDAECSKWQAAMKAQQKSDADNSFCNHVMRAPGVLIQVKAGLATNTEITTFLIGHISNSNADSGCCASDTIQDDDTVLACLDLRPTIFDAVAKASEGA